MTIDALQKFFRMFLYLMGIMILAVSAAWSVATILALLHDIQYFIRMFNL